MAPLRTARSIAALVVVAALIVVPGARAADPTPGPGGDAAHPTCSERYPEEGPAGVDLRLGCIVGEVMAAYTGGRADTARPLSTYAIVLIVVIASGVLAILFAARMIGRMTGQRLAPVQPGEWWQCATCRSLNGAAVEHCYRCGSARPVDGVMLQTADNPSTPQSFGSRRKRG